MIWRSIGMAGVALVLVAAARGGGAVRAASVASPSDTPSPTTGPAFQRVVSDDGRLSLEVPVAAIPTGVTPTATAVQTSVASVAAYQLLPLDLALPAPVLATWELDPAGPPPATDGDLAWLGLAVAGDPDAGSWEWLGDAHVDVVSGAYTVMGLLPRFGTIIVALQDARIRGPEAIWGTGYELADRTPVDLDLSLVTVDGVPAAAAFDGDQRFGGGYPARIDVVQTAAGEDRLAATWRCLRTGETSLETIFGIREAPAPEVSGGVTSVGHVPSLGAAVTTFSVTFPITCGVRHPGKNP